MALTDSSAVLVPSVTPLMSDPVSTSVPLSSSVVPLSTVLAPVSVQSAVVSIVTRAKLVNETPRPVSVPAPASAASSSVLPAEAPCTVPRNTAPASSITRSEAV